MEYDIGKWLERLESKIDYLIRELAPPEQPPEQQPEDDGSFQEETTD